MSILDKKTKPSATFLMGSPVTEMGRIDDETLHLETITLEEGAYALEVMKAHYPFHHNWKVGRPGTQTCLTCAQRAAMLGTLGTGTKTLESAMREFVSSPKIFSPKQRFSPVV